MSSERATAERAAQLRAALVKVRAHTSYVNPSIELLAGLLASIERITDAALTLPEVSTPPPPTTEALRALVEKWRERARKHYENAERSTSSDPADWLVERALQEMCADHADELSAALSASAPEGLAEKLRGVAITCESSPGNRRVVIHCGNDLEKAQAIHAALIAAKE